MKPVQSAEQTMHIQARERASVTKRNKLYQGLSATCCSQRTVERPNLTALHSCKLLRLQKEMNANDAYGSRIERESVTGKKITTNVSDKKVVHRKCHFIQRTRVATMQRT